MRWWSRLGPNSCLQLPGRRRDRGRPCTRSRPRAGSKNLLETFSSRQTGKSPNGLEPPPGSCQRTTSRENARSAKECEPLSRTGRRSAVPQSQPAPPGLVNERSPKEVRPPVPAIRSACLHCPRLHRPVLMALGASIISWPATLTASPTTGYWCLSPMACPRSPLVPSGRLTEAKKGMRGRLP